MNPASALRKNGYFLKPIAALALAAGIFIHLCVLVFGHDLVLERLVTPAFDMALAIPITLGTLGLWLNIRNVVFVRTWQKIVYGFITFYFTMSVPIHVRTYFVRDLEALKNFPVWFSAAIIPVMYAMFLFIRNLKYKDA